MKLMDISLLQENSRFGIVDLSTNMKHAKTDKDSTDSYRSTSSINVCCGRNRCISNPTVAYS